VSDFAASGARASKSLENWGQVKHPLKNENWGQVKYPLNICLSNLGFFDPVSMKSRISDLSLVGDVELLIPFFELRAREEREVKRCQLLVPKILPLSLVRTSTRVAAG
jgi:hypothetical protein